MADRIVVMKDGVVQQIADPLALYDKPKNRFVAGFIGSPSMNFLRGTLAALDAAGATIALGDQRLVVPLASNEPLATLVGREVVVGLRPEAVLLAAQVRDERTAGLAAEVDVVEPSGARTYLHLRCEGQALVADLDTLSAPTVRPGERLEVRVNLGQLHLFDAASERTVVHTSRTALAPRS